MNTTFTHKADLANFTPDTDLMRAIALMNYNNEPYFIVMDGVEFDAYKGTESEELENWANYIAELGVNDERQSFAEWCADTLDAVEDMQEDEERDGYICLTDEEADLKAKEYCEQTAWAFNADFLESLTDLPKEAFEAITKQCEDGNEAMLRIIKKTCGIEYFVDQAISADGRGHFMNSYDGNENEASTDIWGSGDNADATFYIYRMN